MDELKPVAWFHVTKKGGYWISPTKQYPKDQPLYFSPPQREWQGLTDEERAEAWAKIKGDLLLRLPLFSLAIETKLREKNHAV